MIDFNDARSLSAIPTRYRGYHFRSRTEARWAVFFDAAGIRYEYEPEGFHFNDGTRYLPDFWLTDFKMWFEVKGKEPTKNEIESCSKLARQTKHRVLLAIGAPNPDNGGQIINILPYFGPLKTTDKDYARFILVADDPTFWLISTDPPGATFIGEVKPTNPPCCPSALGYAAARSARFEHGQSGAT